MENIITYTIYCVYAEDILYVINTVYFFTTIEYVHGENKNIFYHKYQLYKLYFSNCIPYTQYTYIQSIRRREGNKECKANRSNKHNFLI